MTRERAMRGWIALLKRWVLAVLAMSVGVGCGGEGEPPRLGPNLIRNGSFEGGLEGWWHAASPKDGKPDGTASVTSEAADLGALGLALTKGTTGWGSMVGQETEFHQAGETYQVRARLRGAVGGESVTLSFHGQGFEVEADTRWRTVSRLVLLPEEADNTTALIAVTTNGATVQVDDVFVARAEVARGDADEEEDNLLRNGSFESDLGMWNFSTNAGPEGTATTSPEASHSGYAGMVLSKGSSGAFVAVKQPLPHPISGGDEYRLEAHVKGALGGESMALCVQINREPWSGPCVFVTATDSWQHISEELTFEPELVDERMGALVSLVSEGTVMVDDVIVVRTRP
jgi:hypothetical protein